MPDNTEILIRSEEDAWKWFEVALNHPDEIPQGATLRFDGWPTFHMHFEGKDWHSSVPSRVMSPLLDVQHDLHRVYARAFYGKANTGRLTKEDRDRLEIILDVKKGSSEYNARLWEQLTDIAREVVNKMEPNDLFLAVLGFALIWGGTVLGKEWFRKRIEERQIDNEHALALLKENNEHDLASRKEDTDRIGYQEETKRLELMARAARALPEVDAALQDFEATQNRLLKAVKPMDAVHIGDVKLPGSVVSELVHAEREYARDETLSGNFLVLANDTTANPGGFRLKVSRLRDGLVLYANVPIELPASQKEILRDAEWSKGTKIVEMTLQAEVLRGSVTNAEVVSVGSVEPSD